MYRKEVNEQSPLRILEQSIHGGLGPGNLGVVMARAGVGKTAALVQIGLDDLMRERNVLHIALGEHSLKHVREWYDALFTDMAHVTHLERPLVVHDQVDRRRMIQAHPETVLTSERLENSLALFGDKLDFRPQALLVDGLDWEADPELVEADLRALKSAAKRLEAELWLTARTHREETGAHPMAVPKPCAAWIEHIDVALLLEPQGDHVSIRLLKDHDHAEVADTNLELQPDTMRLVQVGGAKAQITPPSGSCTLLSGAARGSEQAFGECAEQWGLGEINFTFEGRPAPTRSRGLCLLSENELQKGAVSGRYVEAHMHRNYPDTPAFRKILRSIWHQVNTAGQVFVVGVINEDGTVKGGTGWAAELAKHLAKPLHVFDQNTDEWKRWVNDGWQTEEPPTITARRFTGTGTRFPSESGTAAIKALFERSFSA